jgi:hypothetical protein
LVHELHQDKHGRNGAYFDSRLKPFQVRLSGPPVGPRVGPAPFEVSKLYVINVLWADNERKKWEELRASKARQQAEVGPLTSEEKQWLKNHWGNEFKFLMSHDLNINKDEDREEGRSILRAIMAGSDDDDSDVGLGYSNDDDSDDSDVGLGYSNDDDSDDSDVGLGYSNDDHPGVLAEPYFDADKLKFIKKHYSDPPTFMITFGLKFYKADDCEEARSIIGSLMYPESDDSDE